MDKQWHAELSMGAHLRRASGKRSGLYTFAIFRGTFVKKTASVTPTA